jgi:hypothetical protein
VADPSFRLKPRAAASDADNPSSGSGELRFGVAATGPSSRRKPTQLPAGRTFMRVGGVALPHDSGGSVVSMEGSRRCRHADNPFVRVGRVALQRDSGGSVVSMEGSRRCRRRGQPLREGRASCASAWQRRVRRPDGRLTPLPTRGEPVAARARPLWVAHVASRRCQRTPSSRTNLTWDHCGESATHCGSHSCTSRRASGSPHAACPRNSPASRQNRAHGPAIAVRARPTVGRAGMRLTPLAARNSPASDRIAHMGPPLR